MKMDTLRQLQTLSPKPQWLAWSSPMTPTSKLWVIQCSLRQEADLITYRADSPAPLHLGPSPRPSQSLPCKAPWWEPALPCRAPDIHVMQHSATRKGLHKFAAEPEQTHTTLSVSEVHKMVNRTNKENNPSVLIIKGLPLQKETCSQLPSPVKTTPGCTMKGTVITAAASFLVNRGRAPPPSKGHTE